MSDTVERLRKMSRTTIETHTVPDHVALAAADEIERLRAELHEAKQAAWNAAGPSPLAGSAVPTEARTKAIAKPAPGASRLRTAIDTFLAEVDSQHAPEWASPEAKAAGKEPWLCVTCGVADGHWPCAERMALDDLIAARRKDQP